MYHWQIPAIAFGSGSVNKRKDVHQYIEQALEAGFSHLDTAQCIAISLLALILGANDHQDYENEASVGRAIRESGLPREDLYVTTKWGFGNPQDGLNASLKNVGFCWSSVRLH